MGKSPLSQEASVYQNLLKRDSPSHIPEVMMTHFDSRSRHLLVTSIAMEVSRKTISKSISAQNDSLQL